jgi:four helix bundle protein
MEVPGPGIDARCMNEKREVLFDQDRLDAYGLARRFAREVEVLVAGMARGQAESLDQVRRASLSIALNTAEGAGEFVPKEKARFYRIARRSATEAAAVLDNFVDRGVLSDSDIGPARSTLHRTVGALTRLIKAFNTEPTRPSRRNTP